MPTSPMTKSAPTKSAKSGSRSSKDKKLLALALILFGVAGGIYYWTQANSLKPGMVLFEDGTQSTTVSGDGTASADTGEVEVEHLDVEDPATQSRGGFQLIDPDGVD